MSSICLSSNLKELIFSILKAFALFEVSKLTKKQRYLLRKKGFDVPFLHLGPVIKPFDFYVDKSDGCWNWTGYKDIDGYGRYYDGIKTKRAHRIAWVKANGEIPDGLWVLHHCDNPSCVNPAHLRVGTHRDNALDRDTRGHCARAKLDATQVTEIRNSKAGPRELARRYGVTYQNIWNILAGKTWRHV